ncbi:MAG: DUF481 domain-containing protein, partial [Flavobacteriales bacterium]|nr:DUF481 domain-containing protein [Flavobacteriales bacterium]
ANAGAFGVEAAVTDANGKILTPGKNLRSEFGGYVKLAWTKKLMENVNFTTKLDLFSNYLNNPQNIDVNWETLLDMKINSFLSASLITQLLYDDDVTIEVSPTERGPRTQFKEVLGVGLTVKLGDKR